MSKLLAYSLAALSVMAAMASCKEKPKSEDIITRSDGSKVFSKVFTKKDFDKQLDDDYRKTGILEGLVFDRVEDGKVRYAASVSHPQTDEYIPLVVMIDRMGHMTIDRDTQMDVSGQTEEEEEI